MWACRVSPVSGSNTATVSPAKSTNVFSPAACVWRIVPQPKHLANPSHRQSLRWHPASPAFVAGAGSRDSIADGQPALTPPQRWPPSIGILPAISWNQWPLYVGIRKYMLERYRGAKNKVFLSGADAYALRCAYVHEGGGKVL